MRGLLLTSAAIVLVAVSAPSVFMNYVDRPGARERPALREAVRHEVVAEPMPQAARQVEVRAARDGHFYVDAEINFRSVRLMVDTGATVVALRRSDAIAAGIRVLPADFVYPVQTANGTTKAAEAVLTNVAVDDIEVRNVRALVLPDEQLTVSLLGGSFLNALQRFEVSDGRMILEE